MERNEYLKRCQRVSVQPENVYGRAINDESLIVEYGGSEYYPTAYKLWFSSGKPMHTAVLHSVNSKSIIFAPLDKVKFKEDKQ